MILVLKWPKSIHITWYWCQDILRDSYKESDFFSVRCSLISMCFEKSNLPTPVLHYLSPTFFCARMRGKLRNCWCFVPFWWITPGRAILPCKIELPLICQTFNFGKPFFYWTFSQTIKDRRRYLPFPHFGDFTASINQYPIHLINFVHLCGNPLRYMFFYFN